MISILFGVRINKATIPCAVLIVAGFLFTKTYNQVGWLYQFPMWCAGLIVFCQFYERPIDYKLLKWALGILASIATVWGILNYFKVEPYHLFNGVLHYNPQVVMSGPLFNHTLSSVYPALAFCMGFPWYLLIFFGAGLLAYNSTMSILAVVIGLLHFHLDKRGLIRWWLYPVVIGWLFVLHGVTEFFHGQERFDVWMNTLKWSPIQGGGLGYFHDFYRYSPLAANHKQVFIQEHNEYLAAYTTFGVAGVLLALFVVLTVLKSRHSRAKSTTVAFLFICMGSFPLHISSLAIIGIMLYTLTIQGDKNGIFINAG